jgi:DNA-binding response OmpR family regulator
MDGPKLRVLIVDDDAAIAELLARSLRRHGEFEVDAASSVDGAHELLRAGSPDAVLLDLTLSMMNRHALLQSLRQSPDSSGPAVFMITRRHDGAAIKEAARAGASGFIQQPLNAAEISFKIQQAVDGGDARAAEVIDLLQPERTLAAPVCSASERPLIGGPA